VFPSLIEKDRIKNSGKAPDKLIVNNTSLANDYILKMPELETTSFLDVKEEPPSGMYGEGIMITNKNLFFGDQSQSTIKKAKPSLIHKIFKKFEEHTSKPPSKYTQLKKDLLNRILANQKPESKSQSCKPVREKSKEMLLPPTPRLKDPELQALIKQFPIVSSMEEVFEQNKEYLSKNKSRVNDVIKQ
jgi:hypothetical protein